LLLLFFSATLFYIWLSVAIGAGPQWVIALCWIGMGFLWASGVFACFPSRWKRVRFVLVSGFVITLAALFAELGVRMPLANRESRIDGAIKANMHDSDRALERHDSP
jgi:O-antigen ligase